VWLLTFACASAIALTVDDDQQASGSDLLHGVGSEAGDCDNSQVHAGAETFSIQSMDSKREDHDEDPLQSSDPSEDTSVDKSTRMIDSSADDGDSSAVGKGRGRRKPPRDDQTISGIELDEKSFLLSWMVWRFPQGVGLSVGIWGAVLLLTWAAPWWSRGFKEQAADRVLSTCHAVVSTIFGLIALFTTPTVCRAGNSWMLGAVQCTLGFFIVDFCSMMVCDVWMKWRPVDLEMFVHHSFLIMSFGAGCYYDYGIWVYATLLTNEASTPFLNALWLLINKDLKSTWVFMPVGISLAIVFFMVRIVLIPYVYYQAFLVDFCPTYGPYRLWVINSTFLLIYGLNLVWFGKLLQGAIKTMGKSDGPKVEGSGGGSDKLAQKMIDQDEMNRWAASKPPSRRASALKSCFHEDD
jgi:hypothetical protein